MVSWSGLGADPVPGDVATVDRTARQLGAVGDRAEQLVQDVRGIDAATAPAVWRGPAADSFKALLGEVGPRLTDLAAAYDAARSATAVYSTALAAAQEKARRAEADAERARHDHDVAQRAHDQAAADAGGWWTNLRALELRLADAATRLAEPVAATDPAYHAQLVQWQQQIAAQRTHAATRKAEAEGRKRAADAALQDADFRLALARGLATEAADDVTRAAHALATALGVGSGGSPWKGLLGSGGWQPDPLKFILDGDGQYLKFGATAQKALFERTGNIDGRWGHADGTVQFGVVERSVDGKVGHWDDGTYGIGGDAGIAAYLARATANGRLGSEQFGLVGSATAQAGARANIGTTVGIGKNRVGASADAEAFAGGELDGSAGLNIGGVTPKVDAKLQYGIGAAAKLDAGYHDGKIRLEGKLGLVVGLGGTIDPSVEIDVGQVARNAENMGKGAERFAEKSFKSLFSR